MGSSEAGIEVSNPIRPLQSPVMKERCPPESELHWVWGSFESCFDSYLAVLYVERQAPQDRMTAGSEKNLLCDWNEYIQVPVERSALNVNGSSWHKDD